jgi:hypothetical protein
MNGGRLYDLQHPTGLVRNNATCNVSLSLRLELTRAPKTGSHPSPARFCPYARRGYLF